MKERVKGIIDFYKTKQGRKVGLIVIAAIVAVIFVINTAKAIFMNMNAETLECKYESAVADYSKLKIEESITNVFINGKRSKIVQKNTYTVLKNDKDTLESMKKEKKMYASTFKDIKGASAKYKAYGKKITTTVTYHLKSMEKEKREDLQFDMKAKYADVKKYYEDYGYTCK